LALWRSIFFIAQSNRISFFAIFHDFGTKIRQNLQFSTFDVIDSFGATLQKTQGDKVYTMEATTARGRYSSNLWSLHFHAEGDLGTIVNATTSEVSNMVPESKVKQK